MPAAEAGHGSALEQNAMKGKVRVSALKTQLAENDVHATLTYVARTHEPLYNFFAEPPADGPPTNEVYEPQEVTIGSMRCIPGARGWTFTASS